MYKINLFRNLKSPANPKVISIDRYIDYIKNGIDEQYVQQARYIGKGNKRYDSIKEQRLCVTHNFLFDGYKEDLNIISSTGLLYYDIDLEFDLSNIDNDKIYIHHKSLSGIGKCVIVKASGITSDNFKENYLSIASELGIYNVIDTNAIKKTQSTVISYDPNIYYNPNSFEFTATEKVSFIGNMSSSSNLPKNDTFFKTDDSRLQYRLTNAGDYVDTDKLYQVFPEGLPVAKINIPRNIPEGRRTIVLMAIANQIVALNPNSTYEQTLSRVLGVNEIFSQKPLPENKVIGIVNSIIRYKENGSIKPINNQMRKIIFNTNCKLTKEEKRGIVGKEIGVMRVNKTKQKIHDAIQSWDRQEKITAKKIGELLGMGIATIKRYWPEFKILVKHYNNQLKDETAK